MFLPKNLKLNSNNVDSVRNPWNNWNWIFWKEEQKTDTGIYRLSHGHIFRPLRKNLPLSLSEQQKYFYNFNWRQPISIHLPSNGSYKEKDWWWNVFSTQLFCYKCPLPSLPTYQYHKLSIKVHSRFFFSEKNKCV